jgi:CHRD domain
MRTRLVLGLIGALVLTSLASATTRPAAAQSLPVVLSTTMTGAQEVPGPGDPDGRGTARIFLLPDGRTLCYLLTATGIEPATAAHIHRGSPTEAGPVVVPLSPPTFGVSGGCTEIDPALHQAIRTMPSAYYVNVHNTPFPGGAIRGQL